MKFLLLIPAVVWLIISALFNAAGDYFSKHWAYKPTLILVVAVMLSYALSAITWLPALLHKNNIAIMGTLWFLFGTVAVIIIGVLVFGEALTLNHWIGILLALTAFVFLAS
jgi:multidrug transporter EmrE-like cation transporter